MIAPTVPPIVDLEGTSKRPQSGVESLPRWRGRQIARTREVVHASGAVIAALLLGALIAWASSY